MKTRPIILLTLFSLICLTAFADTPESDLSLEDILNLKIQSVSKKEESLFDAPLSASVITRQDILNAGATNIQEAFRLLPGMIVREQSNGNFDIHLRGFDGVPEKDYWVFFTNTTTLVMIDNRIVYNYFQGGTFWETLPIALNDIDRIEVVRGPTSALYGPNAVSGVINIITKKPAKEGFSASTSGFVATHNSRQGAVSMSYAKEKAWSATLSVNAAYRKRKTNDYTFYSREAFGIVSPDLNTYMNVLPNERFPRPDQAQDLYGVNGFFNYQPAEKLNFDLSIGHQSSFAQKVYFENLETALSTMESKTQYIDVKARYDKWLSHFSFMRGNQLSPGIRDVYNEVPAYDFTYDLRMAFAELEYDQRWGDFSLRPGVVAQNMVTDGRYISGKRMINNFAFSLRSDYTLAAWRFAGALRLDKYHPVSKPYQSWQLAATHQIDNHLVRAVYSRANKFPSMSELYLALYIPRLNDSTVAAPFGTIAFPYHTYYFADQQLPLMTEDMLELGHRFKLAKSLQVDQEFFYAMGRNFPGLTDAEVTATSTLGQATTNTAFKAFCQANPNFAACKTPVPARFEFHVRPRADANQIGWTGSVNWATTSRWNNRFFATIQKTMIDQEGIQRRHSHTPALYGGTESIYRITDRLKTNLNTYFYTAQEFYARNGLSNATSATFPTNSTDPRLTIIGNTAELKTTRVPGKWIFSGQISYAVYDKVDLFLAGRNVFNYKSREFPGADESGSLFAVGLNAEL